MKRQDAHLSPEEIQHFFAGITILRFNDFRHLQDCDQCYQLWLDLMREARSIRTKKAKDETIN